MSIELSHIGKAFGTYVALRDVSLSINDGELVALDESGVSRFQLLQNALRHEARLVYYVFDVMFAGSGDLRSLPLTERKTRLKSILPKHKAGRL